MSGLEPTPGNEAADESEASLDEVGDASARSKDLAGGGSPLSEDEADYAELIGEENFSRSGYEMDKGLGWWG